MNSTGMNHPLTSAALAVGVTDVLPTVQWAMSGFHGAVPDSTSSLIAGLVVAGVHFGLNWLSARAAAKTAAPTAGPAA